MFSTITENRDRPRGKLTDDYTLKGKSTQYDLGKAEWQ
jgi:hypothetical protein